MRMLLGLLLFSSAAFADATYTIPVPVDLSGQGSFALPSALWTPTESGRELSYAIPADLVGGKPIEIKMTGKAPVLGDGLEPFAGDLSSGGCTLLSAQRVLCVVQYKLKTFGDDPEAFSTEARRYLESKYAGSPELPARLKAQALFQNEPAGIVSLLLN